MLNPAAATWAFRSIDEYHSWDRLDECFWDKLKTYGRYKTIETDLD